MSTYLPILHLDFAVLFLLGHDCSGSQPIKFLMYLNLYEPMTAACRIDLKLSFPRSRAVICVLLFARLMSLIMKRAYAGVFHFILGIVIASTAIIILDIATPT